MASASTEGASTKSGGSSGMLIRLIVLVLIAGGVYYGIQKYYLNGIIEDELAVIEQEAVEGRFREYDPKQTENRGGGPPRGDQAASASEDSKAATSETSTGASETAK